MLMSLRGWMVGGYESAISINQMVNNVKFIELKKKSY